MRSINRVVFLLIAFAAVVFAVFNIYMTLSGSGEKGRPYRVEAARLARQLASGGEADLSGCEYVTSVTPVDSRETLLGGASDYLIMQAGDRLYRFDYTTVSDRQSGRAVLPANLALAAMAVAALALTLYIRSRIIKPFHRLSNVPIELSKGNLTVGLREEKSRFFGRFVWGMDMLRESLERQRVHELELQKEKKTLVLSLSHDLKTPLSAVKLYARALEKNLYNDDEKRRQTAACISAKADEMEDYIARIIKASSEDFLHLDVRKGEFYLKALLESVRAYYDDKLGLLRTEFSVDRYDDCLISGDLDRAVEVVQNLMENAVKYGDGEQIELLVADEEGCRLITVRNTGCTLPDNELPHIFDSFWRGSNAAGSGGSGLGLHICRRLMQLMDGDVYAQKTPDGHMEVTAVFRKA